MSENANDIKTIGRFGMLRQRIMMNFSGEAEGLNTGAVIEMLIKATPKPCPEDYA